MQKSTYTAQLLSFWIKFNMSEHVYASFSNLIINNVQDFKEFIVQNNIQTNETYIYTVFCQLFFNSTTYISLKFTIPDSDIELILKYLNSLYRNFYHIQNLLTSATLLNPLAPVNMTSSKMSKSINILNRFEATKNINPIISHEEFLLLIDAHQKMANNKLENLKFLKPFRHDAIAEYQIIFPEFAIVYRTKPSTMVFPNSILQYLSLKKSILKKIELKKLIAISQI